MNREYKDFVDKKYVAELQSKIKELEAQVERMKNGMNCKHMTTDSDSDDTTWQCRLKEDYCYFKNCKEWEARA